MTNGTERTVSFSGVLEHIVRWCSGIIQACSKVQALSMEQDAKWLLLLMINREENLILQGRGLSEEFKKDRKVFHEADEFIEVDFPVPIFVNSFHQIINEVIRWSWFSKCSAHFKQQQTKFSAFQFAITVFIKMTKYFFQFLFCNWVDSQLIKGFKILRKLELRILTVLTVINPPCLEREEELLLERAEGFLEGADITNTLITIFLC